MGLPLLYKPDESQSSGINQYPVFGVFVIGSIYKTRRVQAISKINISVEFVIRYRIEFILVVSIDVKSKPKSEYNSSGSISQLGTSFQGSSEWSIRYLLSDRFNGFAQFGKSHPNRRRDIGIKKQVLF